MLKRLNQKIVELPNIFDRFVASRPWNKYTVWIFVVIGILAVICNVYLKYDMTLWDILIKGMIIYLPGDFLKISICAVTAPKLMGVLKKSGLLE